MAWKQFRKVDRISGMHPSGKEAEEWQQHQHLPVVPRQITRQRHDDDSGGVHQQKRPAPPKPLGQRAKGDHSQSHSGSLDKAKGPFRRPLGFDQWHAISNEQLRGEVLARDDHAPERAQPHRRQQEPEDGTPREHGSNWNSSRRLPIGRLSATACCQRLWLAKTHHHPEDQQRRV